MFTATVVGNVVSTVKNPDLQCAKLMVVQPTGSDLNASIIAVDCIGVGVGEVVLVVHEGGASRICYNTPQCRPDAPVDAVILGVVDGAFRAENR